MKNLFSIKLFLIVHLQTWTSVRTHPAATTAPAWTVSRTSPASAGVDGRAKLVLFALDTANQVPVATVELAKIAEMDSLVTVHQVGREQHAT